MKPAPRKTKTLETVLSPRPGRETLVTVAGKVSSDGRGVTTANGIRWVA